MRTSGPKTPALLDRGGSRGAAPCAVLRMRSDTVGTRSDSVGAARMRMPGARPSRSRRNTDSVPARTVVSSTLLAHLSIARIRPRVPARRPPLLTAGYRRAGRRFHAVKGRSPRSPKQPGSGCGQARRISRRRPVCRSRDSETGAPILPDTGVTSHRRCCRHTRLIRSPTGLVLLRVCDSNGCMPRSTRGLTRGPARH